MASQNPPLKIVPTRQQLKQQLIMNIGLISSQKQLAPLADFWFYLFQVNICLKEVKNVSF